MVENQVMIDQGAGVAHERLDDVGLVLDDGNSHQFHAAASLETPVEKTEENRQASIPQIRRIVPRASAQLKSSTSD
jgi:hypothetical protein